MQQGSHSDAERTFATRPGNAPPVPPGVLVPGVAPVPGKPPRDAGVAGADSGAGTGVSAARTRRPQVSQL